MNDIKKFAAYAAMFEEVYVNDNWQLLEPFFHPNAVYEMVGEEQPLKGRDAIFAGLKKSLDECDRRFETRELVLLDGPKMKDDTVYIQWRANYSQPGLPTLCLEGEETLKFVDGRIVHMKDSCSAEVVAAFGQWMEEWGAQL